MPRSAPLLRRRSTALVFAAALAALSACGGSDDGDDTAASPTSSSSATSSAAEDSPSESSSSAPADEGGGTVTVTGMDFEFDLAESELAAGEYEIEFVNDGGASHDVRVEQDGEDIAQSDVIPPGETTTFTVTLEPGEYVFYCSVGNHRGMGMETTVTVT